MEATLLTFKIVLDSKGNIVSDLGGLPIKDVDRVFKNKEDAQVIKKIIREGTIKLQGIHRYLENEVTAVQYVE
jgi:ribosome maturation protein Sdo1|tara:strand:+ start:1219 stop:1437 length:219 start_codon:yes stop_codon:yes gene_type:complete